MKSTKWYKCARCDAGYPDQGCTCVPEQTQEELFNLALDLFILHQCERYTGCEVCGVWKRYADKFGWNDKYPTEPGWTLYDK